MFLLLTEGCEFAHTTYEPLLQRGTFDLGENHRTREVVRVNVYDVIATVFLFKNFLTGVYFMLSAFLLLLNFFFLSFFICAS